MIPRTHAPSRLNSESPPSSRKAWATTSTIRPRGSPSRTTRLTSYGPSYNEKFTEDGYYVRADSPEMASEIKRQLSEFSPETLADVLTAVSDKLDLVRAIEGTGHANFLADYLTGERKRQAIADLEEAVRDPNSLERRFQAIIEKHPWLFGGQYVATRPERMIVLGDQFDVPLVRADTARSMWLSSSARTSRTS